MGGLPGKFLLRLTRRRDFLEGFGRDRKQHRFTQKRAGADARRTGVPIKHERKPSTGYRTRLPEYDRGYAGPHSGSPWNRLANNRHLFMAGKGNLIRGTPDAPAAGTAGGTLSGL